MKKLLNKKGMTLVEVIVVLVILAILAAVLVPSMVGWIDKAKDSAVNAEARAAYLAAQTLASEAYGLGTDFGDEEDEEDDEAAILALADLTGKGEITELEVSGGKVTKITYKNTDRNKTVTIEKTGS